jgi:dethiobiotin synthetase
MTPVLFITGTDTGVGKTVLTSLLARQGRVRVGSVAALKPICSGGRTDARVLCAALAGALRLDEINPWHFREALAPRLAARKEGRAVRLADVVRQVRAVRRRFVVVLVEGAGGLLSPLGEDFDSRDLIVALRATPIVVCSNRLGAVNQALLVLAALPPATARRAQVVLVSQARPDGSSRTNAGLLGEVIGAGRVHRLPWLRASALRGSAAVPASARPALARLLQALMK